MKGQLFIHMQEVGPEAINIRTGVVKQQIGAERWLLEFNGAKYRFSNIFSAEQLERFVFFNTKAEQDEFLADLQAQNTPPPGAQSNTPAGVTVDAPAATPAADVPAAPTVPNSEAPGL